MTICLSINVDEKLISGLSFAFAVLDKIQKTEDEEITIDFSKTTFVSPTFVLPLFICLKESKKQISLKGLSTYLSTICFEEGYIADNMRIQSFVADIERYSKKSYIPIIDFPTLENRDDIKNKILSTVENIIIRQIGLNSNIAMGFKYIIEEYVDNITQHSRSKRGYIFAQAYPNKHYLDICIADTGITLLGSYKENGDIDIATDLEAIRAANRGISTKNLPRPKIGDMVLLRQRKC